MSYLKNYIRFTATRFPFFSRFLWATLFTEILKFMSSESNFGNTSTIHGKCFSFIAVVMQYDRKIKWNENWNEYTLRLCIRYFFGGIMSKSTVKNDKFLGDLWQLAGCIRIIHSNYFKITSKGNVHQLMHDSGQIDVFTKKTTKVKRQYKITQIITLHQHIDRWIKLCIIRLILSHLTRHTITIWTRWNIWRIFSRTNV